MQGHLYIITAPSGTGKTTLVKALLERSNDLYLSISYTTRAPRSKEVDREDYFFIDTATFESKRLKGEFLESAEIYGHHYATSKTDIRTQLESGRDVLLEIDWQGALSVKKIFPKAVLVFILPPSLNILKSRLTNRKQDTPEAINHRFQKAGQEIKHLYAYDYICVNHTIQETVSELEAIIKANKLTICQQKISLNQLITQLLKVGG